MRNRNAKKSNQSQIENVTAGNVIHIDASCGTWKNLSSDGRFPKRERERQRNNYIPISIENAVTAI